MPFGTGGEFAGGASEDSQGGGPFVPTADVVHASTIRQTVGAPVATSTDQAGDFAGDVTTYPTGVELYAPFSGNGTGGSWPAGIYLGGVPLGQKLYAPASRAAVSVTGTTLTTLDSVESSTNWTVAFVAPPSGKVNVILCADVATVTAGSGWWALLNHTGGALEGNPVRVASTTALAQASPVIAVVGLTAGTTYQFDWAAASDTAGDGVTTYAQGQTSTTIGATGASPANMIVLPA
jgi:hypothetical protein